MDQQEQSTTGGNPVPPPSGATPVPTAVAEAGAPLAGTSVPAPQNMKKRLIWGGSLGLLYVLWTWLAWAALLSVRSGVSKSFLANYFPAANITGVVSGLMYSWIGFFALVTLVILLVGVFYVILGKGGDEAKKKKGVWWLMSGAVLVLITMGLLALTWSILRNIPTGATPLTGLNLYAVEGNKEYQIEKNQYGDWIFYDYDTTQKKYVPAINQEQTGLSAPIVIKYDAKQLLQTYLKKNSYMILERSWDLNGDGKFEANAMDDVATYRYDLPGTYQVKLRIRVQKSSTTNGTPTTPQTIIFVGPGGSSTIKEKNVKVEQLNALLVNITGQRPNIKLTATPASGAAPLTVQFDASGTVNSTSGGLEYDWDFKGDGTYVDAHGSQVEHTFSADGRYPVYLRVRNDEGISSYAALEIVVSDKEVPQATFTATPTSGEAPLTVQVDASEAKGVGTAKLKKYVWNFGDNVTGSQKIAKHVYKNPGEYTITLTVTDEMGREGVSTQKIQVLAKDAGTKAYIQTVPAAKMARKKKVVEGDMPLTISFDGSLSAGNIVLMEWDFDGDGVVDEKGVDKVDYTYRRPGEFQAILRVTDSNGQVASDQVWVTVKYTTLKAEMQADKQSGEVPLTVSFDASASRYANGTIERFKWNFGDQTPATVGDAQVTHIYDQAGEYTAQVTVLTNDGQEAKQTVRVIVTPTMLTARFSPSIRSGVAPLTVSFDGSLSRGNIQRYAWNFGDNSQGEGESITHTFTKPGEYEVTLSVYDDSNNISVYKEKISAE